MDIEASAGLVDSMTKSRAERAAQLEDWAEHVDSAELKLADTAALRAIAELIAQRDEVDHDLIGAVRAARDNGRSWAEIGTMLGVSKQAAQQKYGPLSAAS